MPCCMAHYQFGQDILNNMNFTLKQLVTTYKNEFDIGLQGPDIFFSYQMLKNPSLFRYAIKSHTCSANQMFSPLFSEKPTKGSSFAYLLGLLCHYFLDSACHTYVFANSANTAEHMRMESAYDKAIMRRYDYGDVRHPFLPLLLDYPGIAMIWPSLTVRTVETSIRASYFLKKALDTRQVDFLISRMMKAYGFISFWNDPNLMTKEQATHEKHLDRLYSQALADGTELIETIFHSIGRPQPVHERFKVNFFGEMVEA